MRNHILAFIFVLILFVILSPALKGFIDWLEYMGSFFLNLFRVPEARPPMVTTSTTFQDVDFFIDMGLGELTTSTSSTSTTSTTSTSSTTTSTLPFCFNDELNDGEIIVDCGGPCAITCDFVDLEKDKDNIFGGFIINYIYTGYSDTGDSHLLLFTSFDNLRTERTVHTGEIGYVENLEYEVIDETNETLLTRIKIVPQLDPNIRQLMVGGKFCATDDFCTRTFMGYNITLMDRDNQRYKVILPDGAFSVMDLSNQTFSSPDNKLLLKTVNKMVVGGYSIIQVDIVTPGTTRNWSAIQ